MQIETAAFRIGDWKSGGRRKAHKDKNPRMNYHPGMPFFIPIAKLPIHEERDSLSSASRSSDFRVALRPPFPSLTTVASRLSYPVTAAGPQRIFTAFPYVPSWDYPSLFRSENYWLQYQSRGQASQGKKQKGVDWNFGRADLPLPSFRRKLDGGFTFELQEVS